MKDRKSPKSDKTALRLSLVGKPLVGFDTTRWTTHDDAASAVARVGGKPGGGDEAKGPSF